VKPYHADNNHPFGSAEFQADIKNQDQELTFSGIGAHHQNGLAEIAIRTVTSWARAMLLHLVINWPEQTNLELWPFTMNQAVYLWNHMSSKNTRHAPLKVFASTRFPSYNHLQSSHVWGCPVYVLKPSLQDNKKNPKWKTCSRQGMYLFGIFYPAFQQHWIDFEPENRLHLATIPCGVGVRRLVHHSL
jgi:hypothetical protein